MIESPEPPGYLTDEELQARGFASLGTNVRISRRARVYRPERISLGNNVRVDDFVTLTPGPEGAIRIGNYVHIAAYSMVESPGTVTFEDFSGLAARVTIYGASDDYGGDNLTNPCVPFEERVIHTSDVRLGRHAVIGTGSVILPGSDIGDGCAVGSMALIKGVLPPFGIYIGIPAKRIKERSRKLLEREAALLERTT